MVRARRRPGKRATLSALVVGCLVLVTLDLRSIGPIQNIRGAAATATQPFVSLSSTIASPFGSAWNGISDYDEVVAENEELRAELDRLRAAGALEANARDQLDQILAQEQISSAAGLDRVLARVVGGPTSNFSNTVWIDRGSNGGVDVGMTVINEAGLVGRVVSRTPSRSVVELADTRGFSIGVRAATEEGEVFVATGQGSGQPLRVLDAADDSADALATGTAMVSSGLGVSAFPPEVFVGSVRGAVETELGDRIDLEVDLAADLDRLGFVTVLDWLPLDVTADDDVETGSTGDRPAGRDDAPAAKAPR